MGPGAKMPLGGRGCFGAGLDAQRESPKHTPPFGGIAGAGLEPQAESGLLFVQSTDIAGAGLEPATPAL